jgi:hypothetical protein
LNKNIEIEEKLWTCLESEFGYVETYPSENQWLKLAKINTKPWHNREIGDSLEIDNDVSATLWIVKQW